MYLRTLPYLNEPAFLDCINGLLGLYYEIITMTVVPTVGVKPNHGSVAGAAAGQEAFNECTKKFW